jgi:transposase
MRKSYTSNLTDKQWALIEPLIPPARSGGDRRTSDMREVVDGIRAITTQNFRLYAKTLTIESSSDQHA